MKNPISGKLDNKNLLITVPNPEPSHVYVIWRDDFFPSLTFLWRSFLVFAMTLNDQEGDKLEADLLSAFKAPSPLMTFQVELPLHYCSIVLVRVENFTKQGVIFYANSPVFVAFDYFWICFLFFFLGFSTERPLNVLLYLNCLFLSFYTSYLDPRWGLGRWWCHTRRCKLWLTPQDCQFCHTHAGPKNIRHNAAPHTNKCDLISIC